MNAKSVKSASRNGRNGHTFADRERVVMDEARRIRIGKRLQELREAAALTQPQAAEKAGIGFRTYQGLEYGESGTKIETYERLAGIFGVPVTEIIGTENGEPAWVEGLRERLARVEAELQDLKETVAQSLVARALEAGSPSQGEAPAEAEPEAKAKRSR